MDVLLFLFYNYLSLVIKTKSVASYSVITTVVVLGDSYSDNNSHMTELLKSPYAALGNRSKELMWPVQLVKRLENDNGHPKLHDYAYNGAHANNLLTNFSIPVPDTKHQTTEFLTELDSGKVSFEESQSLVIWWVGINPLDAIWIDACGPQKNGKNGAKNEDDPLFLAAIERTDGQVVEVQNQVINLDSALLEKGKRPRTTVVITVPDITTAPLQRGYAKDWSKGDEKQEEEYLRLLRVLISRYNQGLKDTINEIELKSSYRIYDVEPLWNNIRKYPVKYGITDVNSRCFFDPKVCPDPNKYFYWDYIHPGPQVEKAIAIHLRNFLDVLDLNLETGSDNRKEIIIKKEFLYKKIKFTRND